MNSKLKDALIEELLTTIKELRAERAKINASLHWSYKNVDVLQLDLEAARGELKESQTEVRRLQALMDAQV